MNSIRHPSQQKMAGLCWTPVVLVIILSAQHSFGAVDQSWLTNIVEGLKNEYALGDAFTLAVNIPQNQDPTSLKEVLQSDPVDKVTEAVSQGQVYQGTRVIAATQTDGLSRVLENIQSLANSSQGNVLVIYSEVGPSSNDNSMADKIDYVIQNWSAYAFLFSRVADIPAADTSQLAESFKLLEISKLGLDNIFRCYKPSDSFQCTSCSSGGDVTPSCLANSAPSDQKQSGADTAPNTDVDPGAITGSGADADSATDVATGAGLNPGESAGSNVGTDTSIGISTGAESGLERQDKSSKTKKCKGRSRGCKQKTRSRKRKAGNVRRSKKRGPKRNGKKRGTSQGGRRGSKRRGGRKGGKRGGRKGGKKGGRKGGRKGGKRGGKRSKSVKRRGGSKPKRSKKRRGQFFWEW